MMRTNERHMIEKDKYERRREMKACNRLDCHNKGKYTINCQRRLIKFRFALKNLIKKIFFQMTETKEKIENKFR